MQPILSVSNLSKTYASGFRSLKNVNLEIRSGEIFALLGPNGAGATLINQYKKKGQRRRQTTIARRRKKQPLHHPMNLSTEIVCKPVDNLPTTAPSA
jgi:ABC-type branched-subunit amino acid transport system ATPase component